MKQGKLRTMSICASDIPKEKLVKAGNGKLYLQLETWDYDEPDKYDNDFSVSVSLTKEERKAKEEGKDIKRVFLGSGKIWEPQTQTPTTEELDDLPF